ncbi:gamma-glutamyl-gamma-aminobutyrate hydrolase family protein, partial [Planktomarina sp.]|nr:gamma-glutamyl-gamma-aminobutyrate hydrolase family protein [Planktomarina sp.]
MKLKIGISQRVDSIISHAEYRDAVDQRLTNWVAECGCIPVPIPNNLVDLTLPSDNQPFLDEWLTELNIDAILLSGGNDLGEVIARDLTESYLLIWAEKLYKPVLGICRGMQMMSVYGGSDLVKVSGHVSTTHNLVTEGPHSKNVPKSVNSYHQMALKKIPEKYLLLAKSEDG